MSKKKNVYLSFVLSLALLVAAFGVASGKGRPSRSLNPVQEISSVGAGSDGCAFAGGLAVGLGIASLFGCVACAVAAVAIDVVAGAACLGN